MQAFCIYKISRPAAAHFLSLFDFFTAQEIRKLGNCRDGASYWQIRYESPTEEIIGDRGGA